MAPAGTVCFGALTLQAGGSGVSTYSREILHELALRAPAAADLSAIVQRSAIPVLPERIAALPVPDNHGVVRALRAKAPIAPVDLFHSLDADLPVRGPRATVSTIHDLSVIDTPWASGAVRARGEQALVRDALRRADAVIAVSQFTAERIWYVARREAHVTHLAPAGWARPVDHSEVEAVVRKYDLPDRFVFHLGTLEPRKRPHVVAEAARAVGIPFVLAGKGSTNPKAPASAIGLGYVDAEDLPALYAAATVVAYASVYEGFGLPPVEAMACGGVVMASSVGALPDVVGDGALLIRGNRLADWTTALAELVGDVEAQAEYRRRAPVRARELSWRTAADETLAVYAGLGVPA